MMDKLEPLFEDLVKHCRNKSKDEWDKDFVLELVDLLVEEDYPTTLDNASNWDIVDEVQYRGLEDEFYEDTLSDCSDDDLICELEGRNIGVSIDALKDIHYAMQRNDKKEISRILENLIFDKLGRIAVVEL